MEQSGELITNRKRAEGFIPASPCLPSDCDLAGSRQMLPSRDCPGPPCQQSPLPGFSPAQWRPPSAAALTQGPILGNWELTSNCPSCLPPRWSVYIRAGRCFSVCPPPAERNSSRTWSCQTVSVATKMNGITQEEMINLRYSTSKTLYSLTIESAQQHVPAGGVSRRPESHRGSSPGSAKPGRKNPEGFC